MKIKSSLLLCSLLVFVLKLNAQSISGKTQNTKGETLPFVSIYTSDFVHSTSSNADGGFELKLPKGEHELVFKMMGYETLKKSIKVDQSSSQLTIHLKKQTIILKEVEVSAKQENPAYAVMRQAIAHRAYFQKQVSNYTCNAYIKGSGELESIPKVLLWMADKKDREMFDKIKGKKITTENISEITYNQKNKFSYHIISQRTNFEELEGGNMAIPILTISLYDEGTEILSPLAHNAFSHYRFTYQGFFEENGNVINKIEVKPRHKGDGLYTGTIYIVEDSWNIHTTNLRFDTEFGKARVIQNFSQLKNKVWMPIFYDMQFKLNRLGIKGTFNLIASLKEYDITLNQKIKHSILQTEVKLPETKIDSVPKVISKKRQKRLDKIKQLRQKEKLTNRDMIKISRLVKKEMQTEKVQELKLPSWTDKFTVDSLAEKRTDNYWNTNRIIPLTEEEKVSEQFFDSLTVITQNRKSKKKAEDSLKALKPKSTLSKVFGTTGKMTYNLIDETKLYDNDSSKHQLSYVGLIHHLQFNTVDGFHIGGGIKYSYDPNKEKTFSASGSLIYATARERFLGSLNLTKNYAPKSRGQFRFEIGSRSVDFNQTSGMHPILNSVVSLVFHSNYLKLYQKDYIKIENDIDIKNGLKLSMGLEYAKRSSLENSTDQTLFPNWKKFSYTSNKPINIELADTYFNANNAVISSLGLEYTPKYFYRMKGNKKKMAYSDYPTFSLSYKKGWKNPSKNSIDYDFISLGINQNINLNFQHQFHYLVKAGKFINDRNLTFADFYHFDNVQLPIYLGSNFGKFRLMDYYYQSTGKEFFQASTAISSSRLLLKRLPLVQLLNFRETVFANYLYTPDLNSYVELGYGVYRLFGFLSAEVATGYQDKQFQGFKVKIGLKF